MEDENVYNGTQSKKAESARMTAFFMPKLPFVSPLARRP